MNHKKILKNPIIFISIIFSIGFFSFHIFNQVANAQSVETLKQQIQNTNVEKAKIEAEIEEYKKQLEQVGAEKNTLANKIKSLEITQKKLVSDINLTQTKINSANLSIADLQKEINVTQEKISDNYVAISKTIRNINSIENVSFIEILLTSSSQDFWNEIGSLSQLQTGLKQKIAVLSQNRDSFVTQKTKQENAKIDLIGLQNELDDRKQIVDENKNEQNQLLKVTKNKESEYSKALAEKQDQYEKFQQAIFEYENQIKYLLDKTKLPAVGSGVLAWPLDKIYVTQKFGVTSDSGRLYTSGSHNGVDFRAAIGTKLMTARSGTVVATGNTDLAKNCFSYGKWILIKHENGLTTLYGHLSVISVKAGDKVTTGQTIGYTGDTGYATGPHLHLTVIASDAVEVVNLADYYTKTGQSPTTACAIGGISIPVANTKAYLDPLLYL